MDLSSTREQTKLASNKWVILFVVVFCGLVAAAAICYWGPLPTKISTDAKHPFTAVEFGTAFNGIVGTSITILGLAFLYYAYRDQQRQAEIGLLNKLYDDLQNDINGIQYRKQSVGLFSSTTELHTGPDALFNYAADDNFSPNSVLNQLNLILVSFEHVITLVNGARHQPADFERMMKSKIYFLYLSKVCWPCYDLYMNKRRRLLGLDWGNAKVLFYKYEALTLNAYAYLSNNDLVSGDNSNMDVGFIDHAGFEKATSWQDRWEESDMDLPAKYESDLEDILKMCFSDSTKIAALMAVFNKHPFVGPRKWVASLRGR